MASFNREGPMSFNMGQGLNQTARFPHHLSTGRRPWGNRNRNGFGQGGARFNENQPNPVDHRGPFNAAASNHTQQRARPSGEQNYPTNHRGDNNRVRRPRNNNQHRNNNNNNNNNNRKFNNVFIPNSGKKGYRGPRNPRTSRDGDVAMEDAPELFRQENPDSDVEMRDAFAPLEHPLVSLIQASARSAAPRNRRNRNKPGRRDADGDIEMPDAPPLRH